MNSGPPCLSSTIRSLKWPYYISLNVNQLSTETKRGRLTRPQRPFLLLWIIETALWILETFVSLWILETFVSLWILETALWISETFFFFYCGFQRYFFFPVDFRDYTLDFRDFFFFTVDFRDIFFSLWIFEPIPLSKQQPKGSLRYT